MPVQQYTAEMHLFLSIAVLAVIAIISVLAGVWLHRAHDSSDEEKRRRAAIRSLARKQDDVISDVIVEISSNPATYADFPQRILSELMRLHSVHPSVMKGKVEHELF